MSCAARERDSVDFVNKSFITCGNIQKPKGKRVKIPTFSVRYVSDLLHAPTFSETFRETFLDTLNSGGSLFNNTPCLFEIKVVLIIYQISHMRIPKENISRNGREHTVPGTGRNRESKDWKSEQV